MGMGSKPKGEGGEDSSKTRGTSADQAKGGSGASPKMVPQPRIREGGDSALAMRGMASSDSEKHWKGTGYSVPTKQSENHTSRSKK